MTIHLTVLVKFPTDADFSTFADANWRPQDASIPKPNSLLMHQSMRELKSISGYIQFKSHGPVSWSCLRQDTTAQSSYEAEVYAVNEATLSFYSYLRLLHM